MPVVPPPPVDVPKITPQINVARKPVAPRNRKPKSGNAKMRNLTLAALVTGLAFFAMGLVGGIAGMAEGDIDLAMFLLVAILGPIIWTGLAWAYFAPTAVAYYRDHRNLLPIAVLNLTLGWMLFGWIGALVWSLTADRSA